jgi:hypothetical protein
MIFPHTRSCSIAATMLWLGIAQAAPANAPEQQRGFASPEEAVTAFVAALRNHNEADLRAILGPTATVSSIPATDTPTANSRDVSSPFTTRSTPST